MSGATVQDRSHCLRICQVLRRNATYSIHENDTQGNVKADRTMYILTLAVRVL